MEDIAQHIEALIFASEQGIRMEEILYCLQAAFEHDFNADEINGHIDAIRAKYGESQYAIEVVKINNGYQFLTKKKFHPVISLLQLQRSKKKLSQAALETLAIIAYKQPVTKLDVEQIRGVNCDYSIQKLLEKELIAITGKAESVGKPILYGTSSLFMDYFGINNITELPQLKEFTESSSTIGEATE
ncbi:SMC-Scp complex subunit ScpB [Mucilaginibacter psychrotolerans]|uniref:SMC-Scp complex subunit ScpB n=1 Tax=Mucilaginibacter psychrotolerans TaxID=1524096 RepID=A0A4Y8S3I2_9SPHI|nr:SMC-Scp complex subunit ScpB [Mucilaginibacter psychrotolerans]TFF33271.1 SMC-Scp complex subunit ScpB [Mucilaginibacter psychrotolerans]